MKRALVALALASACAPAEVPWSGGGAPATGAADRRVADLAELWIAAGPLPAEVRARTAAHVLGDLERLPAAALSRSFALDARLLALDAQRYLAKDLAPRVRFEQERGRLPPPEELATLRACLARVLSSTAAALSSCASEDAQAAARADQAPPPRLDELVHLARISPYATSPIRQATADPRVEAAWRLVLADRASTTAATTAPSSGQPLATVTATVGPRAVIAAAVRPALAELGRYEPADATWTLFAALWLLEPPPGPPRSLAARLEHHAEQGLVPPWIGDAF